MKRATSDPACGRAMLFVALPISAASHAAAPVPEPVTDQETELGKAVYDQLRAKAEIIDSSPLYDTLKPVAEAISRVSQSRYPHPFKFYLVHEAQPNAFATPGGNVYVVDSLLGDRNQDSRPLAEAFEGRSRLQDDVRARRVRVVRDYGMFDSP